MAQIKEIDSKPEDTKPLLDDQEGSEAGSDDEGKGTQTREEPVHDPRFDVPTPSPYKRVALLLFTAFLFWAAFKMRGSLTRKEPEIIYAKRCVHHKRTRKALGKLTSRNRLQV
jgi:hypothetical protein